MARVAGVDLPRDKRGEVALTYIFGIGRSSARRVLAQANLDVNRRVREWSEEEVARVREVIERNLKVEGDLRREVTMNVKRLMDISSYRGLRHRKGLPVRGQRTHTNARTRKGPRRGVGIRKKSSGKNPTTGKKA
jgi:small subunit ribosomal protein S13